MQAKMPQQQGGAPGAGAGAQGGTQAPAPGGTQAPAPAPGG